MNHPRVGYVAVVAALCGAVVAMQTTAPAADQPAAPSKSTVVDKALAATPAVTVYKNASCGCCGKWVEHMRRHGFELSVHDVDNLGPLKEKVGLPYGLGSCHTAQVGGYFIEGHVPAIEVARLLKEAPKAKGLTVPGMPLGSPGMEQGDQQEPYDVLLVKEDGSTSVFAHYPK